VHERKENTTDKPHGENGECPRTLHKRRGGRWTHGRKNIKPPGVVQNYSGQQNMRAHTTQRATAGLASQESSWHAAPGTTQHNKTKKHEQ